MFSIAKISAAALALASVVRADLFITSYSVQINGTTTVNWVSTDLDTDPTSITVQLGNPAFRQQFAISSNVPTTQMTVSLATPGLTPGSGYSVQLVKIDDVNTIFAETAPFTLVGETAVDASSISAGPPSTSSTSSSTSSRASTSTNISASSTSGAAGTSLVSSNTPAVTSVPAAATTPASTSNTAQIPGTSGSPAASPNNNAAVGLVPAGAVAAVLAGAVALLF